MKAHKPSNDNAIEAVKEFLFSYRTAIKEKESWENRLKSIMNNISISVDYSRVQSSNKNITSSVENYVVNKEKLEAKILIITNKAICVCDDIISVIETLSDIEDRKLLYLYYVDCKEWWEVENEMFISKATVFRRLNKIIKKLLQDSKAIEIMKKYNVKP